MNFISRKKEGRKEGRKDGRKEGKKEGKKEERFLMYTVLILEFKKCIFLTLLFIHSERSCFSVQMFNHAGRGRAHLCLNGLNLYGTLHQSWIFIGPIFNFQDLIP